MDIKTEIMIEKGQLELYTDALKESGLSSKQIGRYKQEIKKIKNKLKGLYALEDLTAQSDCAEIMREVPRREAEKEWTL